MESKLFDRFMEVQTAMLMRSDLLESRDRLDDAEAIRGEWSEGSAFDALYLTPDSFVRKD